MVRDTNAYGVVNPRVVNPPTHLQTADASDFARLTAWYEAKSFADGGQTLMFGSTLEQSLNLDDYSLDLNTGQVKRLTTNIEWDEDEHTSPEDRWLATGSDRTHSIMGAFSQIPRPALMSSTLLPIHLYYQSGDARLGEFRSVVLFRRSGETDTDHGIVISNGAAQDWYLAGGPFFSSDGQKLTWAEFQPRTTNKRLVVARLNGIRRSAPTPVVATPTPSWAVSPEVYPRVPLQVNRTFQGKSGRIELNSGRQGYGVTISAVYQNYSTDGNSFLSGTETLSLSRLAANHYSSHLQLSGLHHGNLDAKIEFLGTQANGKITSKYDERALMLTYPPGV
jgi:uncharacterized DUF497 family protein